MYFSYFCMKTYVTWVHNVCKVLSVPILGAVTVGLLGVVMVGCADCLPCRCFILQKIYSRLSLSQIPRDLLKHCEISVPRHIRVERVRKTMN